MRRFSQTLLAEMEEQLREVHIRYHDPVSRSSEAIKKLVPIMERLKTFSVKHKFPDTIEEIEFFREIKPRFSSRLIYYNDVYTIEIGKPVAGEKAVRKYYKYEMDKLKSFFDDNADFYRYYRSGCRELDMKYFVRGKFDLHSSIDGFYFQADTRFTTARDYKVAKIIANEMLLSYIQQMMEGNTTGAFPSPGPQWTASKVALVELIYALHAQGALNNGKSDLRELADFFEKAFAVDLGQYHKTFVEIRERKSDRAKFLTALKDKFIQRMDEADEN